VHLFEFYLLATDPYGEYGQSTKPALQFSVCLVRTAIGATYGMSVANDRARSIIGCFFFFS
jgi:hypothetical protein